MISATLLSLLNNNNNRGGFFASLFNKEKYVGSNRERTTREKQWSMTRKELFLSTWNKQKLIATIFHAYKDLINGPYEKSYFISNVPKWMQNWKWINKLDEFEDHKYNFVDTSVKINRTFIKEMLDKLRTGINTTATFDIRTNYKDGKSPVMDFEELTIDDRKNYYAPIPYYKASGLYLDVDDYSEHGLTHNITDENNEYFHQEEDPNSQAEVLIEEIKTEAAESCPKRDYFDVEDYRNLESWNEDPVYVDNSMNRYNNRIPLDRKGAQRRFYDRSNEGLRQTGDMVNDRFRKFDLKDIYENNSYWN